MKMNKKNLNEFSIFWLMNFDILTAQKFVLDVATVTFGEKGVHGLGQFPQK